MEPLSHSSAGEAIDQVPLVVLAKRVTSHRHSAIVVKSVDRIERTTTSIFGAHQNAMRKFAIDQRREAWPRARVILERFQYLRASNLS